MTIAQKSILLIISGGIAAYKTPDLVRRLRQENISVTCILTGAGAEFVTPLTPWQPERQPCLYRPA